jgi:hypothetical protein
MKSEAIISRIEGKNIWVTPVLGAMCLGCNGEVGCCSRRKRPYQVINPRGLNVSVGRTVSIDASAGMRTVQAFFALGFPLACAIAGLLAAEPIARSAGMASSEGLKVLLTLGGLGLAGGLVMLVNATSHRDKMSEIVDVL